MIKILFHSYGPDRHCYDGFGAAYALWTMFGDNAEYIPCEHGKPEPEIYAGDAVYLVDFIYPREVLLRWNQIASITVLDHHKTAQADLLGLSFAEFDMSRSGAQMAWDWVANLNRRAGQRPQPYPPLIDYIADRDLWLHELPYTKEIARALATFPFNFVVWDGLAKMPNYVEFMRNIGEPLQRQHELDVEKLVATADWRLVGEHRILATHTTKYHLVSDALNLICQRNPETPFAVNYSRASNGIKFELRSVGDFDVSAVAKQFGGGGHKNAAGFTQIAGSAPGFQGDPECGNAQEICARVKSFPAYSPYLNAKRTLQLCKNPTIRRRRSGSLLAENLLSVRRNERYFRCVSRLHGLGYTRNL